VTRSSVESSVKLLTKIEDTARIKKPREELKIKN
jgi:hypothetical protein